MLDLIESLESIVESGEIAATPVKLRSGDWGVRVMGKTKTGDQVVVRAKTGKVWVATIDRVVWSGSDDGGNVSLCSTKKTSSSRRSGPVSSGPASGKCRECRGPIRNAPHHRAMGGLCGNCAFDEYDQ